MLFAYDIQCFEEIKSLDDFDPSAVTCLTDFEKLQWSRICIFREEFTQNFKGQELFAEFVKFKWNFSSELCFLMNLEFFLENIRIQFISDKCIQNLYFEENL